MTLCLPVLEAAEDVGQFMQEALLNLTTKRKLVCHLQHGACFMLIFSFPKDRIYIAVRLTAELDN
jgi:hypothetical protein